MVKLISLLDNMKHLAIGWACNLNDIFVRFPYEKCKSLINNYKTKQLRKQKIKQVFREGVQQVLEDIIENNVTYKIQGIGYQGGELHMEAITDSDFEKARANGKFKDIDFLESMFKGYQMYLYIHGKRDNFLHRRKFPVYVNSFLKNKLTQYTNQKKNYC